MKVGERVRHAARAEYGIGEVVEIFPNGTCTVRFENSSFSGVSQQALFSAEEELLKTARRLLQERVQELLTARDYDAARALYDAECSDWWPAEEYFEALNSARAEEAKLAAEQLAKKKIRARAVARSRVEQLLDADCIGEADSLYERTCADWWSRDDYEAEKESANVARLLIEILNKGTLSELDAAYTELAKKGSGISAEEFAELKLNKVGRHLSKLGMRLDREQEKAIARPERMLLIRARAGSGKTRTLCARAAVSVRDEKLSSNQVMIVAFNKAAASEIRSRVQNIGRLPEFNNARTFHSLAYQLVKSQKRLLFDAGGHPSAREQSRFVQRMMQRILNPAFKEAMVEFFRAELEEIEELGRDLPPQEYLTFRRSLEQVTLRGERVKSSGEKYISDFLFEHGIEYRYERAWVWKSDFLGGAIYKPDFSIVSSGRDYILEHWAIDPARHNATLPSHWDISAEEYRRQARAKRDFWKSKGICLLETNVEMLRDGRARFEQKLKSVLESAGVRCERIPKEEIVRRVFERDFAISRMAELFLQFIQRSKKRGWSADEVAERIADAPDKQPRVRLFHQLAQRAYREYEVMLEEQGSMDFDDLLMQAAEEVAIRGESACIHLGGGQMLPLKELRWILIDEFQDFSELYFRMLGAILKVNPLIRVIAVGDDWQAINAFAGAELRFFDKFVDLFPGASVADITTNYRSDRAIVDAGNRLMVGRGPPAKSCGESSGLVEVRHLNEVWIEFRQGLEFAKERERDAIYLRNRADGRNSSELARRQAQALKLCAQIVRDDPTKSTLLLARTRIAYGMDFEEFKSRLIQALSSQLKIERGQLEKNIAVMTAHGSKGQEADRVIVLNATRRQFPMVHPDNLMFELFGVSPHAVLEEERRLFYVAVTRARNDVFFLTEKDEESPYVQIIRDELAEREQVERDPVTRMSQKRGRLAVKVSELIKQQEQSRRFP